MILHPERLASLHPDLVRFVEEAAHVFEPEFDIAIVSGVRTDAQQRELYAKGRTAPGPIVTNAQQAGDTAHGRAAALDFCPVRAGAWLWKDTEAFATLGRYAEAHGLIWGGRWKHLKDYGHVEVAHWRELDFDGEKTPAVR